MYCLDHLASLTSDDDIVVKRVDGLLTTIQSNVKDETPAIAQKLATAVGQAVVAGAGRGLETPRDKDTITVKFDPLDGEELRRANQGLRRYGYCIYVEGESFDAGAYTGAAWCSRPDFPSYFSQRARAAKAPIAPEASQVGILYRGLVSYKLVLLKKSDPTSGEPWSMVLSKRLDLPNNSPVYSIGLPRAAFATRSATLTFNQGVLTAVKVDKGSELVGFVQIPLSIASAIVNVPAQILSIRTNYILGQADLVQAQTNLFNDQLAYMKELKNAPPALFPQTASANPAAANRELIWRCLDAVGPNDPPDLCKNLMGNAQP
jgi:hypothetical protein